MAKKKEDFDITKLPIEAQDPEIKAEDFVISDENKVVHEQKLQTKPTTFLRDSLKRFSKNKSSVVASIILGLLLLLSVVVPLADQSDVSVSHPEAVYLEPKLFNSGTGFWDGVKKITHEPVDANTLMPNEVSPLPTKSLSVTDSRPRSRFSRVKAEMSSKNQSLML